MTEDNGYYVTTVQETGTYHPAPALPPEPPFRATPAEGICAGLSYLLAILYVRWAGLDTPQRGTRSVLLVLCALLIVGITEALHRGRPRSRESWLWLGCFCVCVLSWALQLSSVWYDYQIGLFIHLFAVWWILSRAGVLAEGETGHLLPLDGVNGFVLIPFTNFLLRLKTLWTFLRTAFRTGREKKGNRKFNWWILFAVLLSGQLLFIAVSLLMSADSGFRVRFEAVGEFLTHISDWIDTWLDGEAVARFLLGLPVGCWLFGLMAGTARVKEGTLEKQRRGVAGFLASLRKVPDKVWTWVIGVFSLFYAAFFLLQGSYLFGAFVGKLPEGFIVSQYAREGFFELCMVIAVNFSLLWLATRMVTRETGSSRSFLIACLVLLGESMLFAVIAFSKLFLYIHTFGFTPLRLQSTWLVCVCLAGCVLWMWHLLTGRKAFRKWMVFSAATLCALCLF